MSKELGIYYDPLTKEQHNELMKEIISTPSKFHLVDVFKQLKFNRPAETQKQLQKFIDFLELEPDLGRPWHPSIVKQVFGEGGTHNE